MRNFQKLFICFVVLNFQQVNASSCCGQSPSSFPVSFLGQKLSIISAFAFTESQGRIFSNNKYLDWENKKREVQSLALSTVWQWKDRNQLFIMSSFNRGSYWDDIQSNSVQNFGDTILGYNYEVLPEYSYSFWRPIVYISAFINIPTGVSVYDNTTLSEGADVTGHNQWGPGIGVTLKKVYFPLSLILQFRTIELLKKRFSEVEVSNFNDTSASFFANYATSLYSLTFNLGYTFNDLSPRRISSMTEGSSRMQNSTVLLGMQKNIIENFTLGFNYLDQTILGPASNSLLNRVVSLNLSYNFY